VKALNFLLTIFILGGLFYTGWNLFDALMEKPSPREIFIQKNLEGVRARLSDCFVDGGTWVWQPLYDGIIGGCIIPSGEDKPQNNKSEEVL
jgi:hypothetical protein